MSAAAQYPVLSSAEESCLTRAFTSFTDAAEALQRSYAQLQNEIGRLRRELEQANAQLDQERQAARKLQALAEVSTMLAHEIRNPLASLELFANLLKESRLSSDQLSWVRQIQAGLRTLSGSVNNVLGLHAEAPLVLVPTNAERLLQWAGEFLRPLATQAGVRLEVRNNLAGTEIVADAHSLQQVLLNLALNALHVLPVGGHLSLIGYRVMGTGFIELRVTDDGPGIAAEFQEKIFEPGYTTRPGSAGLGLAVCRRVVEQHHSKIRVQSSGNGASFYFRLKERSG